MQTALQTTRKDVDVANLVRKSAGAVYIKNDISCLQRKVWTILLCNAFNELSDNSVLSHNIRVRDLMDLAGLANSKNVGYVKEAIETMVTTKLTWNLVDEPTSGRKGKNEWGVSTALASAIIVDGMCSYSYSHHLREKLNNPEFYASINLLMYKQFSGKAAIALYEIITLHRDARETPWFELDLLRDLLGVHENQSYLDFKTLNRSVIKPAMSEVNTISDLLLECELKRESRKVVAVKFKIQNNHQESLPIESTTFYNQIQFKKLKENFCLTEKQAEDVLISHSEDNVERFMAYVENQYKQGKVKVGKIAPYFLAVVKSGNVPNVTTSAFDTDIKKQPEAKSAAKTVAPDASDLLAKKFAAHRKQEIKNYLDSLSQTELDVLMSSFTPPEGFMTAWKSSGLKSPALRAMFYDHVEKLPAFIPRERAMAEFEASHIQAA